MLQIEHLTKTYGEKKAVDDLSLSISCPAKFTASSATTARKDDDAEIRRRSCA